MLKKIFTIFFIFLSVKIYSDELYVDKIFSPPTEEEISSIYNKIMQKKHTCSEFKKTGKIVFETERVIAEEIEYKSEGKKIYGVIVSHKDKKKYPLFIYNHGGFSGLSDVDIKAIFNIAEKGFVVAASSYRGELSFSGTSEGEIEFAKGEVEDILNLLECAKRLPDVDSSKIFMMGGSHGGINTLLAIIGRKDITCAIDIVGPASLFNETYKKLILEMLTNKTVEEKINLMAGANIFSTFKNLLKDANNEEESIRKIRYELISRSPLYFVKYINCPVLMVYGGSDPLVPIEDAYSLEREFKNYKKEYYLKIFPEQGHGFTPYAQMQIENLMNEFLKKYTEIVED